MPGFFLQNFGPEKNNRRRRFFLQVLSEPSHSKHCVKRIAATSAQIRMVRHSAKKIAKLTRWLQDNMHNPYPDETDKALLASQSGNMLVRIEAKMPLLSANMRVRQSRAQLSTGLLLV
jgi:hypothetical protein